METHTHTFTHSLGIKKGESATFFNTFINSGGKSLLMKKLLEAVWGFENLRNFTVQLTDDLVYGLLPGRINIFACDNGIEKLS